MPKKLKFIRAVALTLLVAYAQAFLLPSSLLAQSPGCDYNPQAPSLENARKNFKSLNYRCAEEELNLLLKSDTLSLEDKSNAHILMAAVYYAMLKDNTEKKNMVMEQFKAAFKAYRDWKGELDIKSPEFAQMMQEAQQQVDQEVAKEPTEPEKPTVVKEDKEKKPTTMAVTGEESKKEKKAWYKNWWAIALGVGVVAGAVALAAGGGGGDGGGTTPDQPLPGFPEPPAGKTDHGNSKK